MSTAATDAQGESHEHGHSPFLQHHFYTMSQQASSAKLGMWLFLAQEVLFFSALFTAYFVFRSLYPETYEAAHYQLNATLGGVNTIVLLTSSLTMALAVRAAQTNNQKWTVINLSLTIAFAFAFLVVKYFEYSHKIHLGLLPGAAYSYAGPAIPGAPQLFFALYFCMTGLHGIHVVAGIFVLSWILWRSAKGHFNSEYFTPVENVGLYWHLVDLVWIFLFPLLYLVK
jgi:cytochrome c oxidase subunit 3